MNQNVNNSDNSQSFQKSPRISTLKFLHISPNHCNQYANRAEKRHMEDNAVDIAVLQDTDCNERETLSTFSTTWKISTSRTRSAHFVVKNVSLIIHHLYTVDYCIFINVTGVEGELIIGSSYLALSNKNFDQTLHDWQHLITQQRSFICGVQLNANPSALGMS